MLKFYKNKTQEFECLVEIEGASTDKAKPRLIFSPEKGDKKIFFEGEIKENGTCIVDVSPDATIGKNGNLVLEIIVDETTVSQPWNSDYEIVTEEVKIDGPKVTIKENKNIPKITVKNTPKEEPKYVLHENHKHFKTKILDSDFQQVNGFMTAIKETKKSKKKLMEAINAYKPSSKTKEWATEVFNDLDSTIAKISMFLKEKQK